MQDSRPALQEGLSVEDFRRFYWRKDELGPFCRQKGISLTGPKADVVSRVEKYLETGVVEKRKPVKRVSRSGARSRNEGLQPLSLDTPIPPNYTSSQEARAFFESVIGPQFHFTIRFMKFCRENPGKTYRDAVHEWYAEREEKKRGKGEMRISLACEYNRFVREYLAANDGKTLKDAADAWNIHKTMPRDGRL
ncbi:DUF6434 domain-containing protein [Methanocella sp. MCL-LM]|uniref:DUF6434 domain-containing protein n=1 Tax=Methanocella sp. MCL-LM TaxID=3412035 RepID=UPI003C71C9DB